MADCAACVEQPAFSTGQPPHRESVGWVRSPDQRSDIRRYTCPAYRGACHRARVRATRWLMRATNYADAPTAADRTSSRAPAPNAISSYPFVATPLMIPKNFGVPPL